MERDSQRLRDIQKIDVCYFQRRPRLGSNYSMEAIFNDVRQRLADRINAEIMLCSRFNDGYVSKVFNIIEARRNQSSEVNHITGEVHFVNLLMRRNRVVLTIHDCGFMERKSGLGRAFVNWLYLDGPVKRSYLVTTVSEETKNQVVSFTSCDPEKIRVIPNPIDDNFQPAPKEFNADKPVILQIGTGYNKNIDRLAAALERLSCTLVIVGKLSEEQHDALRTHGVEYDNRYNLTKAEMIQQYQQCDLVSFVSTFEGFGMPIVEANAVGRPVVTSNASSMSEVAGDAACLVDPFDVQSIRHGLDLVISSAAYRNALIERGFVNRKRFDADRIADAYYQVYQEVLGLASSN